MNKRAEAFKNYNDAAVLQMLVEILPEMAGKIAAPLGSIDKLTVVSTDGAGQLPKQVTDNRDWHLQTMDEDCAEAGGSLQHAPDHGGWEWCGAGRPARARMHAPGPVDGPRGG
jgi:hypothetical protein